MPLQPPPRFASTDRLVLAAAVLAVAAVLGIAVWSATLPAEKPTPSVDNVSDRYESLDAISATRTTVIERNGTVSTTAVYDATLVPGSGERRLRLLDSSAERYDLRVSNGSTLWLHDRGRATVTRIPLSGPTTAETADRTRRLLLRTNLTGSDDTDEEAPAVAPLPVVPQERAPPSARSTTGYAVRYTGNATVGDRTAYVVRVTPQAEHVGYSQTLWLDTEWLYPLRRQTSWVDDGVRTELTTTYTNVTFNPEVPAGTFRPDIGPNTSVETTEAPETRVYRRLAALRANTSVHVPEPAIPPSYDLTYATRTEGAVDGVGLRYVNRTSEITVSKYNFTYEVRDAEERRRVDERSAVLTRGPTTSVSWNCETYRYTVRGRGVGVERLVAVARSVGCPG